MKLPDDQIQELKNIFSNAGCYEEAGTEFIYIGDLTLPAGCSPAVVDALLCPTPCDGYPSRLFLSKHVASAKKLNWNARNVRLIERNWHAFSLKVSSSLRLAQLLAAHLEGLA